MILILFLIQLNNLFLQSNHDNLFPEIKGLQKKGDIEIYNQDNLFDYINGAADSYLNYDFVELKLQRYNDSLNNSLKIELYEHSSNVNAFGIYSTERPENGNWLKIGGQGYVERDILNFYKGNYYVKLFAHNISNSRDKLIEVARMVENKLVVVSDSTDLFDLFPTENKVFNSESYINKNFLGYEVLKKAYLVQYKLSDTKFDIFLIRNNDPEECKDMLRNYFKSIDLNTEIKEGKIIIQDPYQGDFFVYWYNNFVVGSINYNDEALADNYLERLIKNLK